VAAPIDTLYVGCLRDYGNPELDHAHEFLNVWTGLEEHPRLIARPFFVDVEVQKHGAEGMRSRFADLVRKRPPALLVHVPLTPELDVGLDALSDATKRGVATVEFDADSSWRFEGFIRPRLGSYALFVTTHAPSVARYRAAGARVHLSQWAVSPWYRGHPPEAPRAIDVSFVGRPHGDRPAVIHDLRRRGVAVECYGFGWDRVPDRIQRWLGRGRNHRYRTFVRAKRVLGSSRVSLNLANASEAGTPAQVKGRHFEIPALGACQVTTPVEGLEAWYEPGREIVVAEPGAPLADAVRALTADPARARAIAQAAWRRTWAEHTWERRIDALLADLAT